MKYLLLLLNTIFINQLYARPQEPLIDQYGSCKNQIQQTTPEITDNKYAEYTCQVFKQENMMPESALVLQEVLGNLQLAYPTIKLIQNQLVTKMVSAEGSLSPCRAVSHYIDKLSSTSQIAMALRLTNFLYGLIKTLEIYNELENTLLKSENINHQKYLTLMQKERDLVVELAKLDLAADSFDLNSSTADLIFAIMDITAQKNMGICTPLKSDDSVPLLSH